MRAHEGIDIGDDVMIGPNVSIITTGHPLDPSQRRSITIGKRIVIERNVWIAAGATIIGGVTVGENSVVAAGSVVSVFCSHAARSAALARMQIYFFIVLIGRAILL